MANTDPLWTKQSVIDYLSGENKKITSGIIKDLINSNEERKNRQQLMYMEYKGDLLPIHNKVAKEGRPNNKMENDFRGEIVDQKTGFSFGNPITYSFDNEPYKEKDIKKNTDSLKNFVKYNKLNLLDLRTAKYASICSSSSRLLYIDDQKEIKVMHINPWECIFIKDQSIDEVVYAIRYYLMTAVEGDTKREYYRVEWYDNQNIYYYNEIEKNRYEPDAENPSEAHNFKKVPLLEFPNNEERKGDFEKVRKLIDAYDFIESFNVDEIEGFRNAYLVIKGATIDAEFMRKLQDLGGMELDKDDEAYFLVKNINDQFVENSLKRLKNDIYRFAKAVDMSDEKFSGSAQTGESRKWKLKALADDAIIKERTFEEASQQMFAVCETVWSITGISLKASDIDLQFKQNLPIDLLYHAEVTGKLKGNVSEKTRLELLPFIEDAEAELEQMEQENEPYTRFDASEPPDNSNLPIPETNEDEE